MQSYRTVKFLRWLIHTAVVRAAVFGWLLSLALAAAGDVRVITDTANSEATPLLAVVRAELSNIPRIRDVDARVTIGVSAFRQALAQNDPRPLVAAYLASVEFEEALGTRARPQNITAVFANPDPRYQADLARKLTGRGIIGAIDSPASHALVVRLSPMGVRIIPAPRSQDVDALLRALDSVDVLIALPDSTVLNRSNINHVVRTLYQQRKVLIGYSDTLTRVGSLASVYVTPEATAEQVASVLEQYATTGVLPPPRFVRDVDVSVNDRLARSLNIALPDQAKLLEAIRSSPAETAP